VDDQTSKLVFMGSPEFAVPTLEALVAAPDFDVALVVSQPDRPKGRGKKIAPTPVRQCAIEHDIPTREMSKENYAEVVAELTPIVPDFVVVAAFGLILRIDLLDMPTRGCVNLHPSLLPRYRGVSPVQAAILAGDAETGCTTMLMDEGVDTGDMLLSKSIAIAEDDTAGTLERKLADLGAPLVVDTLGRIVAGTASPTKQDNRLATLTKKIKKEHGLIDWTHKADAVLRRIRAMTPWPSAYTAYGDRRLILLRAVAGASSTGDARPGEVLSLDPLAVATGAGVVELVTVKVEGKKEMSAQAFLAGYRPQVGDVLG
jgi:methionyl-tRNA formyltransferase